MKYKIGRSFKYYTDKQNKVDGEKTFSLIKKRIQKKNCTNDDNNLSLLLCLSDAEENALRHVSDIKVN